MTRARALKQVIRARSAKTGERYTTARRHVLRELNDAPHAPEAPEAPEAPKAPKAPQAPEAPKKGGLSDAKSIEKTGRDLAHWFDVLDKFGGIEKGHTKSAAHLYSEHGVPGWYSQGITVAYERARGARAMNQRCDGAFEVSVSKVLPTDSRDLVRTIASSKKWMAKADAALAKALKDALSDKKSKGFVIRPDGQARYRYHWDGMTVQLNLYPKGPHKTSLVVSQMKLPGAESVEQYRMLWKSALAAIAGVMKAAPVK